MTVQAPPAVAWRAFTEPLGSWWPLAHYKIGKVGAVDAVMEPRVGGLWFERGEDGSTCNRGSVLAWEPPTRLVAPPLLAWTIGTISVMVGWLAVELAPAEQFDTPASVLVPSIRRETIP